MTMVGSCTVWVGWWLQGEAKSAQLIGEAIATNPAFITLRRIEAAREIANTVANSSNKVFLNADSLLLNLNEINVEPTAPPTKRR